MLNRKNTSYLKTNTALRIKFHAHYVFTKILIFIYNNAQIHPNVTVQYLRFCHRSDCRHGFEKNISSCTVSTQLFQWKLVCTFNQHCLSYKMSNRLKFNSSLFSWIRFETVLHWHNFFQDVPHSQKTFNYIKTDTYIFYGPYSRAH